MATPLFSGSSMEFVITTLIFIFLFAILYALITKVELFGENKAVHILIAFSSSLLVLFIPEAKELINYMTPWFIVFLILIIFIMLAVMTLGIKHTEITDWLKNASPGTTYIVIVFVIIIFLFACYKVFGNVLTPAGPGETGLWAAISRAIIQPKVLGVLFLLLIASAIIKAVGFKEK